MNPNDWAELGRRLDAIEQAIKQPDRSRWERFGVPFVAWLAALLSAGAVAWYTAKLAAGHAGESKMAETRAETLAKNELDLYLKVTVLREEISLGFERFVKTKGAYDKTAEDASKSLLQILDTRSELPQPAAIALRQLNNYVGTSKVELLKLPKPNWSGTADKMLAETAIYNEHSRTQLDNWLEAIRRGVPAKSGG